MTRRTSSKFTNWAGNQTCIPDHIKQPRTTEDVVQIVTDAAQRNSRVKAVGSGHSFTDTACTDGTMIDLGSLDALHHHDLASRQVTVGAGIRLTALNDRLDDLGLALANLGDIAVQTLAGATATATHGTGTKLGNLSTMITGFELVTGTGDVIWCDREENSEIFTVGRVGIGALGVITKIRLQSVPAFTLRAEERITPRGPIMEDWQGFIDSAAHAELFFIPGARSCLTKRNNPTDEPPAPPSRLQYLVDKELTENLAVDVAMRLTRRFPSQRNRIAKTFMGAASDRDVVDRSDRVFASPRRVRFTEMEYGLPIDAVPEAVERVNAFATSLDNPPLFPVEVRCSAADDIALSTAYGRDSGWIAVHQYKGMPNGDYFRGVEAIMADYEGRPHWGKLHFQSHHQLRRLYPEWDRFAAVRRQVDPNGLFRNAYLDRVLGPITA